MGILVSKLNYSAGYSAKVVKFMLQSRSEKNGKKAS